MAVDHPIKIQVLNPDGDMAYSVSVLHVRVGDTVTWSCDNGSFILTFSPTPVVEGGTLQSGGSPNTFKAAVQSGASPGRYYYGVSVTSGSTTYTDPGCPEIIVH